MKTKATATPTGAQSHLGSWLARHAALLLSAGLVPLVERLVTVEWSYPYCNDPQDGPATAVFGFPLPYQRFSGAASFLYDVMPHAYALNVVLMLALFYPVTRLVVSAVRRRWSTRGLRVAGALGLASCLLVACSWTLDLWMGDEVPVRSIATRYGELGEMRPLAVSTRHYDCTPSARWFPPKWHAR
jgi:hypothetical protein